MTMFCLVSRVWVLLQQEGLRLNLQEVIIQRCCELLPMWTSCPGEEGQSGHSKPPDGAFSMSSLFLMLQRHARCYETILGLAESPSDGDSESEASAEDQSSSLPSSSSSSSSANSFLLTASTLSFLKARSPLLATLACLSACRGEPARTQSSGWTGYFRSSRKDVALDGEQISREAHSLLKEFPVLRAYLRTMAEPVLGASLSEREEGSAGLEAVICGKPLVGLLLSGPQEEAAQAVAAEAFQKALASKDLNRALRLLELYGPGGSQQAALRDRLLACAALEGELLIYSSLYLSDG